MEIPQNVVERLRASERTAVLTGAGVSAESGVPTFREAQTGLWAQYNAEDLATTEAFARNPGLVWEWYAWRRILVSNANPNAGHYALVEMENRARAFTLITQNVDGLHRKAGSRNLIELHGNIDRSKCSRDGRIIESWDDISIPPRCPDCGAHLRPDVVWFGEALPIEALNEADKAARGCDLFISAGTSALVYPAAGLPLVARESGAFLVEINPVATPLTALAHFSISAPSGIALPAILNAAWGH